MPNPVLLHLNLITSAKDPTYNKIPLTVTGFRISIYILGEGGIVQATTDGSISLSIYRFKIISIKILVLFFAEIWQIDPKINKKIQGTQNNQKTKLEISCFPISKFKNISKIVTY